MCRDPCRACSPRSRWHPLEFTHDRSIQVAIDTVTRVVEALNPEYGDAADHEGTLALWRDLQEWLDEVADAEHERTARASRDA